MSVPARDYRALLARVPAEQHSRRGTFEAVLEWSDPLPRGRALDAPCGPGLLGGALAELGFDVVAADLDRAGYALGGRVPFAALDLDRPLPFADESFALVHCGDGIEHLENPFALFRELARVLSRDGTLLVLTPNYLNLARRLRFLWTGSLTRPLRRGEAGPRSERGHINPLTLTRLAWMAESAGLEYSDVSSFGLGVEIALGPQTSALVQTELETSTLRDLGFEEVADDQWLLWFGLRQGLGKGFYAEVGFGEDLSSAVAADFTAWLGVGWAPSF